MAASLERKTIKILRTLALLLSLAGFAGRTQAETNSLPIRASFYAPKFEGRRMANGKPYRGSILSAASTAFPLGALIRVKNIKTGVSLLVRVTDRGPWRTRFRLDLSLAAFKALGLDTKTGWGWVTVQREK